MTTEKEYFKYLNNLRTKTITNNFREEHYLQKQFGISYTQASSILLAWIKTLQRNFS